MMLKTNSPASNYSAFKNIDGFWYRLVGNPAKFALESRIFHSIAICLVFIASFYVPYNFFAGMYIASVSALIMAGFFAYQFYNSRVNGKKHSSIIFGLTGILIFSVNYFANSGIDGSTDLIWPAYLLLVLSISPYKQNLPWLIVYLLAFLSVHLLEYYYPTLVQHPFYKGKEQLIDHITAFPIPVVTIYIIIRFIRRSYDKEKSVVEQRNEEILLQKELLEESNAEKNKLMSIVSHDMRAPLINIQGYLELLNETELDSPLRVSFEHDLLIATNNTMQMLSNLLYWTKSQMERPTVNLQELNLFMALKGVLDMEKTPALKKGITLDYRLNNDIAVIADVDMLQLVVRNLVSNAIKFTPQGGKIVVDTWVMDSKCKITVSDNGKGIEPAKQEKIFRITAEPTYGTNNERGIGLGLLLCKEFIERQGGSIGFESIAGSGSSFFVFIPLKRDL